MSGKSEPIQEITVSDEMLFPDAKFLTGVVERRSAGGFRSSGGQDWKDRQV
jgi:hypothetical protein